MKSSEDAQYHGGEVTSGRATFECQVQDMRLKTREAGGRRELRAPTVSFYKKHQLDQRHTDF